MRKDTRIGVAIGLVLFAVLIVYAVVGSRTSKKKVALDKKGAAVTRQDELSSTESAGSASGETGAGAPVTTGALTGATPVEPISEAAATPVGKSTDAADGKGTTGSADWGALLNATEKLDGPVHTRTPGTAPQPDQVIPKRNTGGASTSGAMMPGDGPGDSSAGRTTSGAGATTSGTHRVEQFETYASISRSVYGDARYAEEIHKANPSIDPRRLRPGMVIHVPEKAAIAKGDSSSAPRADRTAPKALNSSKEYAVQADDSLYKISVKLYGKGDKVDAIYELNKQLIGSDRARLRPGMVLKLPQVSTATPPMTTAAAIR